MLNTYMSLYDTLAALTSTALTIAKGAIVASTGISILLSAVLYFKQTCVLPCLQPNQAAS